MAVRMFGSPAGNIVVAVALYLGRVGDGTGRGGWLKHLLCL